MNFKRIVFLSLLSTTILSCRNKLNLKVIENNDIKIEQYEISEITSIHDFVDVTNKRWNRTERIFEASSGSIDRIFIRNDSIIIQISIQPVMYDLAALKFGYKIIIER